MLTRTQQLGELLPNQWSHVAVAAEQKLLLQLLVLEMRMELRVRLHHGG